MLDDIADADGYYDTVTENDLKTFFGEVLRNVAKELKIKRMELGCLIQNCLSKFISKIRWSRKNLMNSSPLTENGMNFMSKSL